MFSMFIKLLNCCFCCLRLELSMRSEFWSAESEALHTTEHYGPLKTRLYHRAKHYGPLKAKLKIMAKSQIFVPVFYI